MNEFVKKLIDYIDLPPDDAREIKKLFEDHFSISKIINEEFQRQCDKQKELGLPPFSDIIQRMKIDHAKGGNP